MKGFLRGLIWLLGILGAIGVLLYLFVFDVWVVPTGDAALAASILPTLYPQDKIVIQRGHQPIYGELARCASPEGPGYVIGRVFGTGGDRVEVNNLSVKTNGQALAARHGCGQLVVTHPATDNPVTLNCGAAETGAWTFEYLTSPELSGGNHSATVEQGKIYLVSDNRVLHVDSRDFGQVDASTCEHIVFRLWGEQYFDSSRRFNFLW